MRGVLALGFAVALLSGCGGSDDSSSPGDASQVEASVKAQLAKGGSGGVVDLGNDRPMLVTCRKDGGQWHCTVTTAKGRSMLCLVDDQQSQRKVPPTPVCGPIDN